jgi:hypothetical protein
MSCHLVVADLSCGREALREARRVMKDDFRIDHVTVQIEDEALRAEETVLHVSGAMAAVNLSGEGDARSAPTAPPVERRRALDA